MKEAVPMESFKTITSTTETEKSAGHFKY